jgi:capsular exopolysaccharide synthesis family protein
MSNQGSGSLQDGTVKLSPKEIFFKYMVYLPWFIVALAFTITVAYLYIRYTVPLYNSAISIIIKNSDRRSSVPSEISLDNLMAGRSSNLSNEMVILKSATLMNRVVKSRGLDLVYYNQGKVKKSEMYTYSPVQAKVLNVKDSTKEVNITFTKLKNQLSASWEGKNQIVNSGSVLSTSKGDLELEIDGSSVVNDYKYFIHWRTTWSVAGELVGGLNVKQQSKDAAVIQINITSEIPDKGKDVLNQLVREYDQLNIEDKNRIVSNSIQFIEDRIAILNGEMDKVEDQLQGFRQQSGVIDLEIQGSSNFQKIKSLQDELSNQELQLWNMNHIRDYMSKPEKRYEVVPSALTVNDATLSLLIQNYNQLQLQREQDLKTIPPIHPSIKVIDGQLEKVRRNILEDLSNVKKSAENLKNDRLRSYNENQATLKSIPAKQRILLEIERQKSIKEKLFIYLLQKREELAITKASAVGSVTTIDPAVSWGPVSPNTANIYRLAFIFGLVVPFGLIYLRDLLNDKIVTRQDITKVTQTPLIGEIAHHTSMTRKFVVGMKDRSILAEQFRIIRTNLQFLLANAPSKNPVILVTSSIAGEGKTFGSMNMSAVWAVAGKKTVILELDLRKPKISKALGLQRDIGISNYILGNARKEDLPQPLSEIPNLYVIGAGPIPPNQSEMIMDSKMDELFTYLRANFDIIVIDSAPIGLVSDSKILARFADATLYVVRQRYTVKKQMALVDELYTKKILPNMGIIVNDVKIGGANSYYGYGYGYGYGYSYNYNYSYSYGEQQKKGFVKRIKDFVGL